MPKLRVVTERFSILLSSLCWGSSTNYNTQDIVTCQCIKIPRRDYYDQLSNHLSIVGFEREVFVYGLCFLSLICPRNAQLYNPGK
ncbi:hypothetical protein F5X98DRAFT_339235 [Xylaria grammica]|nr:hypothetical protein F5X98DRAFT_339235 [Xylaria grammica]